MYDTDHICHAYSWDTVYDMIRDTMLTLICPWTGILQMSDHILLFFLRQKCPYSSILLTDWV